MTIIYECNLFRVNGTCVVVSHKCILFNEVFFTDNTPKKKNRMKIPFAYVDRRTVYTKMNALITYVRFYAFIFIGF